MALCSQTWTSLLWGGNVINVFWRIRQTRNTQRCVVSVFQCFSTTCGGHVHVALDGCASFILRPDQERTYTRYNTRARIGNAPRARGSKNAIAIMLTHIQPCNVFSLSHILVEEFAPNCNTCDRRVRLRQGLLARVQHYTDMFEAGGCSHRFGRISTWRLEYMTTRETETICSAQHKVACPKWVRHLTDPTMRS